MKARRRKPVIGNARLVEQGDSVASQGEVTIAAQTDLIEAHDRLKAKGFPLDSDSAAAEYIRELEPDARIGAQKRKTQSKIASQPRKDVTKKQLEDYRDGFASRHRGKKRKWITAACLVFKIDPQTLRKRLKD